MYCYCPIIIAIKQGCAHVSITAKVNTFCASRFLTSYFTPLKNLKWVSSCTSGSLNTKVCNQSQNDIGQSGSSLYAYIVPKADNRPIRIVVSNLQLCYLLPVQTFEIWGPEKKRKMLIWKMWQIKTSTLFCCEGINLKLMGLWFWFNHPPPLLTPLLITSTKQKLNFV